MRQVAAILLAVFSLVAVVTAEDSCDWTGSGLDYNEAERNVQPVYLRCSQGKIRWKYPRGALRIVLRHGTSGREFRGCVRGALPNNNIRLFFEGHRTLHPVYPEKDAGSSVRCFQSVRGQLAFYVEAERQDDSSALQRRPVFQLGYDLLLRPPDDQRNGIPDSDEECRPCTDRELLTYYCAADFAAYGKMISVSEDPAHAVTHLRVRSHRLLWQRAPVFTEERPPPGRKAPPSGQWSASIYMPAHCGASKGLGRDEYLLIGRMLLGEPRLLCAPRKLEWERIKKEALAAGTLQCNLVDN